MFNERKTRNFESEVVYNILNSQVRRYPFPHFQTENFLPNDIVELLLKHWPGSREFVSNLKSGSLEITNQNQNRQANFRYQINLTLGKELSRISKKNLDFWNYFSKFMTSPKIVFAFINLFSNPILDRLGLKDLNSFFSDYSITPQILLLHDKTDYFLGPHTDHPDKLFVFLIYFESDVQSKDFNSFGTSIYIPNKKGFKCPTGVHHNNEDFLRVFSADFKKNNAFAFCRSDISFHGVEKVQEKSIERKLLQYSLYGKLKQ